MRFLFILFIFLFSCGCHNKNREWKYLDVSTSGISFGPGFYQEDRNEKEGYIHIKQGTMFMEYETTIKTK